MSIDQLIQELDGRIAVLIPESSLTSPFYGMLKYHLGWVDEQLRPSKSDPGKRVRARLCLLASEAAGGAAEDAMPAATAVELIHNFSLIHDDIQDRSEYRRHRKTVWSIWGEAQGINAGDEMFTLAQLALLQGENASLAVESLRVLNGACRLLCEGQYLDLDFERRPTVTVDEYLQMIARKTAALLEAACLLGGLAGGADRRKSLSLAGFGRQLGIAFQMRDDYLGIWGDPADTGKPAADDILSKKKTLPVLYAMEHAGDVQRRELVEFMGRQEKASQAEVQAVLAILDGCGAAQHTAVEAERASELALQALSLLPSTPAAQEMASLCRSLAGRAK